jgi:hypothetical protein
MPRRWREPGGDWWLKAVIYIVVALIIGYFVVRLGGAIHRRFNAIRRNYPVLAPHPQAPADAARRVDVRADRPIMSGRLERISRPVCEYGARAGRRDRAPGDRAVSGGDMRMPG